jgi:hypothetical protein
LSGASTVVLTEVPRQVARGEHTPVQPRPQLRLLPQLRPGLGRAARETQPRGVRQPPEARVRVRAAQLPVGHSAPVEVRVVTLRAAALARARATRAGATARPPRCRCRSRRRWCLGGVICLAALRRGGQAAATPLALPAAVIRVALGLGPPRLTPPRALAPFLAAAARPGGRRMSSCSYRCRLGVGRGTLCRRRPSEVDQLVCARRQRCLALPHHLLQLCLEGLEVMRGWGRMLR